jgi:hypothetical protein
MITTYPRATAPAIATPNAADFPRPRAAVKATVLRKVFSEIASKKVITAFACQHQSQHLELQYITQNQNQNPIPITDHNSICYLYKMGTVGDERAISNLVKSTTFAHQWSNWLCVS